MPGTFRLNERMMFVGYLSLVVGKITKQGMVNGKRVPLQKVARFKFT